MIFTTLDFMRLDTMIHVFRTFIDIVSLSIGNLNTFFKIVNRLITKYVKDNLLCLTI